MVHGKNRIPYWIDRRLTGLAGSHDDATISLGLTIEPEDCQYGKYRLNRYDRTLPTPPSGVHYWSRGLDLQTTPRDAAGWQSSP